LEVWSPGKPGNILVVSRRLSMIIVTEDQQLPGKAGYFCWRIFQWRPLRGRDKWQTISALLPSTRFYAHLCRVENPSSGIARASTVPSWTAKLVCKIII